MSMKLFIGHYPYMFTVLLFLIGLYGIMAKQNLVKKIIGMNIMQAAVILFFLVHAHKWSGSVPIYDSAIGNSASAYSNPLPHALMLTAIVVSVATTGLALTLIIRIHQKYRSLDESKIT